MASAVRYLSQADTRALLAWPEVIACLAAAYERADDPRAAPPKVVARHDGMWLRALTAISGTGGCMGAKIIAKGRPRGADHFIALWDQQRQLREALKRSGFDPTSDPDSEFFVGRNPV